MKYVYAVTSFGGEMLKLTKLSRSEMGSYLCIASNGVPPSVSKRISLSIHCEYIHKYLLALKLYINIYVICVLCILNLYIFGLCES